MRCLGLGVERQIACPRPERRGFRNLPAEIIGVAGYHRLPGVAVGIAEDEERLFVIRKVDVPIRCHAHGGHGVRTKPVAAHKGSPRDSTVRGQVEEYLLWPPRT